MKIRTVGSRDGQTHEDNSRFSQRTSLKL